MFQLIKSQFPDLEKSRMKMFSCLLHAAGRDARVLRKLMCSHDVSGRRKKRFTSNSWVTPRRNTRTKDQQLQQQQQQHVARFIFRFDVAPRACSQEGVCVRHFPRVCRNYYTYYGQRSSYRGEQLCLGRAHENVHFFLANVALI